MFSWYWIPLGIVAVFFAIAWAKRNRTNPGGQLINSARAQVGRWGQAAEDADPVATLQQVIKDATAELTEQNSIVDQFGAQVEAQVRAVDRAVNEWGTAKSQLQTRINRAKELSIVPPGETDAQRQARETQLARVRESGAAKMKEVQDLERLKNEAEALLTEYRDGHNTALANISKINTKVAQARKSAEGMGKQLAVADFNAKAREALSSLNARIGTGNSAIASLGQAEEKVRQAIDTRVASAKRVQVLDKRDNFEEELDQQAEQTADTAAFDALLAGAGASA